MNKCGHIDYAKSVKGRNLRERSFRGVISKLALKGNIAGMARCGVLSRLETFCLTGQAGPFNEFPSLDRTCG
jgi:hypothetical protein